MKMRCCLSTPGSLEYILRVGYSPTVTGVSPYAHCRSLTIYLKAVIELIWRCTWRPRLSELRDALGRRDRSSLEMHWEAVIERVWRCTWMLRSSELSDALCGCDRANFGDALAGYDRARLVEYLEAVDLEGGAMAADTLFIG
jgi:hypothetical protein